MQSQMKYSMAANMIPSLCHNSVEANCRKMAAKDSLSDEGLKFCFYIMKDPKLQWVFEEEKK